MTHNAENDAVGEVQRYPLNWLLCWHGRKHRRVLCSVNGAVLYCSQCGRKRIGVHEFARPLPPGQDH